MRCSVTRTALVAGLCLAVLSQRQPLAVGEEIQEVPLELRRYFDAGMFVDPNRGFVFSQGSPSALLATEDGGLTWRLVLDSPDDDPKGAPFFLDAERFWFFTYKREIYRTINGGRTFDVYKPRFADPEGRGGEDVCTLRLFFRTEDEAWAPCRDSVQKSTDGGRTWRIVRVLQGASLDYVWMFDAREGIAVSSGGEGGILRTADGGITWTAKVKGKYGLLRCTRDGFCVMWDFIPGWILASNDRGRTWQDLHIPLQGDGEDMLSKVEVVHPRLIVAVGEDVGFTDAELARMATGEKGIKRPPQGFVLTWDGSEWTRINHTDPDNFSGVHFIDESHGWLFADGRVKEEPTRIFKTNDGGRTLEFVPDYFRQIAAQTPSRTPFVFPTPSPPSP